MPAPPPPLKKSTHLAAPPLSEEEVLDGSANRRCATASRPPASSLREGGEDDALSVCTTMKPIQTSARTWKKLHQLNDTVCASERVRGDVRCASSGDDALGAMLAAAF